jgi:hypothetical protein
VTLETNSISSESLKKIYRGFILGRPSNEGDEVKEILSGLAHKKIFIKATCFMTITFVILEGYPRALQVSHFTLPLFKQQML